MSTPSMISGRSGLLMANSLKANAGRKLANPPRCGAQSQQAGLGTLVRGKGIELVSAHGAEKNRIGVERSRQCVGRQRSAVSDDSNAADALEIKIKCVAAQCCNVAQHRDCFVGDFGSDAVAGSD